MSTRPGWRNCTMDGFTGPVWPTATAGHMAQARACASAVRSAIRCSTLSDRAAALCHRDEFGDGTQSRGAASATSTSSSRQSPVFHRPMGCLRLVNCSDSAGSRTTALRMGVFDLQYPERPGLHVRREKPVGVTPGILINARSQRHAPSSSASARALFARFHGRWPSSG